MSYTRPAQPSQPSLHGDPQCFCSLAPSTANAPVERVHHVDHNNLMGGQPVVAGTRHTLPPARLAASSDHTSAHRGCSWPRVVALQQRIAAAVGDSHTAFHTQVVLHRLCSPGWVPGKGPSIAVVGTPGCMDPEDRNVAGTETAHDTAAGPGAGQSLRSYCVLLVQKSMAQELHLLVQPEHPHCNCVSLQ